MVWQRVQWVCQRTPSLPSSDWWPTASACWWRWPIWPIRFRLQLSLISNRKERIGRRPIGPAPCKDRRSFGHVVTCRWLWHLKWHLPWYWPWNFLWNLPRSWLRFRRRPLHLATAASVEMWQHRNVNSSGARYWLRALRRCRPAMAPRGLDCFPWKCEYGGGSRSKLTVDNDRKEPHKFFCFLNNLFVIWRVRE